MEAGADRTVVASAKGRVRKRILELSLPHQACPKADSPSGIALGKWGPGATLGSDWAAPAPAPYGLPSPEELLFTFLKVCRWRKWPNPPQPGILLGQWHRLSPPCLLIPRFDLTHQCSRQDGLGRAEGDSVYYPELYFRIVLSLVCVCWAAQWIDVANVSLPIKRYNQPSWSVLPSLWGRRVWRGLETLRGVGKVEGLACSQGT